MKDTFTSVLPTYNHNEPSVFSAFKPHSHQNMVYPRRNDDGRITYAINREHTKKKDQMKDYKESMYKIKDFANGFKPSGKK